MAEAIVTMSSVVGSMELLAEQSLPIATVTMSRVVGSANIMVSIPPVARISMSRIVGKCRILVANESDEWAAAGLPPPRVSGYSYRKDAGLMRTNMYSGLVRQRRQWDDGRRQVTLNVDLTLNELGLLMVFLDSVDYQWFSIGLVTSDNANSGRAVHTARVMDNPSFSDFKEQMCTALLNVELR